ncbi:MAG: hypothetical protein AAGD22_01045 [Verrucomicrobiota bacterium]
MKALLIGFFVFFATSFWGQAGEVFNSGTLPDFSDIDSYFLSIETPGYNYSVEGVNHSLASGTLTSPLTVRSIEFYGFAVDTDSTIQNHPFSIIIDGVQTVLAVTREQVAEPLEISDLIPGSFFDYFASPVYRYRVDVEPFVFTGDQILIRGDVPFPDLWYWARNATANPGIEQSVYNDQDLTSINSNSTGASCTFILYDTFQVLDLSARIVSFTALGSDVYEVCLEGVANSPYWFRSSSDLAFSPGTVVEGLSQGDASDPGTIGGTNDRVVTTDGSGAAKVRLTLTGRNQFIRGESTDP